MTGSDQDLAAPDQARYARSEGGSTSIQAGGPPRPGWRSGTREAAVAAGLTLALGAASWVLAGPAPAAAVLLGCAVVALVVLRAAIAGYRPPPGPQPGYEPGPTQSFRSFWRVQAELSDAATSLAAWDYGARPRLASLLTARLSERHGISLADDPQAARLLLAGPAGGRGSQPGADDRDDLWYWIDPRRPTPPDASSRPGIPLAVLTALITRLEQL